MRSSVSDSLPDSPNSHRRTVEDEIWPNAASTVRPDGCSGSYPQHIVEPSWPPL